MIAAAIVGFAFFLMELVAPRMLGPLLGGTVFTFGLVLAVALAGVGIGGLLYGQKPRSPRLSALAITCVLEALAFAIPLALGDRVAFLALRLRPLHDFGFDGYVAVAVLITSIMLLPAAIVSGYQFPLLIGLLGSGGERVGRDVGRVYAANTIGSVAGALAGGFFLMQALSAPGCWRLVIVLLAASGLAMAAYDFVKRKKAKMAILALVFGSLALGCGLTALGPTPVWRHGGLGAGRASIAQYATPNLRKGQENLQRSSLIFERDGRETSVALATDEQIILYVSGKADGSSRVDSATQVGSGLLTALRHPAPKRVLVVGLATGCTAGWLAQIPSVERVDVLEIEPLMLDVARLFSPVNENALDNPKVHVIVEDAREHLLTTRQQYDIIVSEPSNPYRAGVATLYTQELYQAVRQRLAPQGIFAQWVQAYEVDVAALRIAFGTVTSVFPHTELWELSDGDLLMLSSQEKLPWNLGELQARTSSEPFRRGLRVSMQIEGVEGMLARLRARDPFLRKLTGNSPVLNTDDQNLLEFSFARTLGRTDALQAKQLMELSRSNGMDVPEVPSSSYDREHVVDELASLVVTGASVSLPSDATAATSLRALAKQAYLRENCVEALDQWKKQTASPRSPVEHLLFAECSTILSDPGAEAARQALVESHPTEARLLQTRALCTQPDLTSCAAAIPSTLEALRNDAWVFLPLAHRTLIALFQSVKKNPTAATPLLEGLQKRFSVWNLEGTRKGIQAGLAQILHSPSCRPMYEAREPNPQWDKPSLVSRLECYERTASPWMDKARKDLDEYNEAAPAKFGIQSEP
jgi:spermidine synthase